MVRDDVPWQIYAFRKMYRNLFLVLMLCLLGARQGHAQNQTEPKAELFCGAELSYADVNFTRLYDVLINLTPGGKIHLGHDWDVAFQGYIPVVNEGYGKRSSMVRLNMANISKTVRMEQARQYFKLTAGLFGRERYGGDLRWMYPATDWLMFHARAGLTNHWALGSNLDDAKEAVFDGKDWIFTGLLGASIWLNPWATELRATGGRYLNSDYGVEGEVIRHFKYCSISLFAQLHEKGAEGNSRWHNNSGGFRIVMLLPPYKKQQNRQVVVRPQSNFRLTYNAQADGYSMRKYNTDPEENERFYPIDIPWGTGNF